MAAIATISLNDGQATPVAHSFVPAPDLISNLPRWEDKSGGIALGYPYITLGMRRPNKASRAYKLSTKVVTPVLEVTSPSTATGIQPAPTLAYNLMAVTDIVLPERSTLAQRKDLLAFYRNFHANAVVTSAVQDFEAVW